MKSRPRAREILEIRHSSLYAPRDFDISPYFAVVKPTIENGFHYKKLHGPICRCRRRTRPNRRRHRARADPARRPRGTRAGDLSARYGRRYRRTAEPQTRSRAAM